MITFFLFWTDECYWSDRLVDLCSYGDLESVQDLYGKVKQNVVNFNINCRHSQTGETPLIAACKNSHYRVIIFFCGCKFWCF